MGLKIKSLRRRTGAINSNPVLNWLNDERITIVARRCFNHVLVAIGSSFRVV